VNEEKESKNCFKARLQSKNIHIYGHARYYLNMIYLIVFFVLIVISFSTKKHLSVGRFRDNTMIFCALSTASVFEYVYDIIMYNARIVIFRFTNNLYTISNVVMNGIINYFRSRYIIIIIIMLHL